MTRLKNYDTKKYTSRFVDQIKGHSHDVRCFICSYPAEPLYGDLNLCDVSRCGRVYHTRCINELYAYQHQLGLATATAKPTGPVDIATIDIFRCPLHDLQKGYFEYINFDATSVKNDSLAIELETRLQKKCWNFTFLKALDVICSYKEAYIFFRRLPEAQYPDYYKIIHHQMDFRTMRMRCLASSYHHDNELLIDFNLLRTNFETWGNYQKPIVVPIINQYFNEFCKILKTKLIELKCKKKSRRNQILSSYGINPDLVNGQGLKIGNGSQGAGKLVPGSKTDQQDDLEEPKFDQIDYSEVNPNNVISRSQRRRANKMNFSNIYAAHINEETEEEERCGQCTNCMVNEEYSEMMLYKGPEIACHREKDAIPLKPRFNITKKFEDMFAALTHSGSGGKQLENTLVDLAKIWEDFHFEINSANKDLFNVVIPLSSRFAPFLTRVE